MALQGVMSPWEKITYQLICSRYHSIIIYLSLERNIDRTCTVSIKWWNIFCTGSSHWPKLLLPCRKQACATCITWNFFQVSSYQ
jgi:hypothetical protein